MARLPVFCPKCKSIFASRAFSISGRNMSFRNNTETCVVCGFNGARLSEGVFNLTHDTIEVISAPDITVAMLKAFAEIALRAAAGQITSTEAIAQASSISPKLAVLLSNGMTQGIAVAALLSSLVGIYLSYSSNKSSDVTAEKLLNAIGEQTYVLKDIRHQADVRATDEQNPRVKPQEQSATKKFDLKGKSEKGGVKKRRSGFGGART